MSSELALITQLLNRIGKEGDAASAAGSVHGKLEQVLADLAASGGGATDYLDGIIPTKSGHSSFNALANNVLSGWDQQLAANVVTVDFVITHIPISFGADSVSGSVTVEVGRGASGAEVVVGRILVPYQGSVHPPGIAVPLAKPVKIPANSRVALRASNSTGNNRTVLTGLHYYPLA